MPSFHIVNLGNIPLKHTIFVEQSPLSFSLPICVWIILKQSHPPFISIGSFDIRVDSEVWNPDNRNLSAKIRPQSSLHSSDSIRILDLRNPCVRLLVFGSWGHDEHSRIIIWAVEVPAIERVTCRRKVWVIYRWIALWVAKGELSLVCSVRVNLVDLTMNAFEE